MRNLILWFYEQLYTRLCWSYDLATWLSSGGLWREWTFTAEQFVTQGPVLEIGCGRGHLLARLANQGYQVAGMDRSPQMAQAARRRLHPTLPDGWLIQGDGQRLPYPNASFGCVITTFPAPYIYHPGTQYEIARVLRSDGEWVWTDVIYAHRFTLRIIPIASLTQLSGIRNTTLYANGHHPHEALLGIVGLSSHPHTWHPRIQATHLFDIHVTQVPVKATAVHVAVLKKME